MLLENHVYSIAPGENFLRRLAQFVLEINGSIEQANDPFSLSRTTIYLPTRRAVRSLRTQFSILLGPKATFLPQLRTLGDGDFDDIDPFLPAGEEGDPARVINPLLRQITLARLVKRWVEMIGVRTRELFRDEDIIIPSSSAESLWLAKEIGDLIDQMETEEISWENFKNLVPNRDEYAGWWQLTLDFLQIAMKSWPEHLHQLGACDPPTHRRLLLDIRARQLENESGLVIAAGSTGSIPATARFLKAVSQLPRGALILPGLDTSMSQRAWAQLSQSGPGDSNAASTNYSSHANSGCEDHPQFGLANLLTTIGIDREEVIQLGAPPADLENRARLTSIALLPSEQTGQWRQMMSEFPQVQMDKATSAISIIEAPAERQEALAIALILRQQIEIPDNHAALVTPDRNLARRVGAELKRFNLNIDDSAGFALGNTSPAIFIRLLISLTTQPANPLTCASFVKHPLLMAGQNVEDAALVGRHFEICLLREVLEIPNPGDFRQAIINFRDKITDHPHMPAIITKFTDEQWDHLISFCHRLDIALSPLVDAAKTPLSLNRLFGDITQIATRLTENENGLSDLFSSDAGSELAQMFEEIINSADSGFLCRPDELLSVFDALIAEKMVRSGALTHPRISILGPLEARLQPLDCVILGALNEGTWPALHDSGPFLNRPMKLAMELATPERRTGLSAHDFEQLMATPKVFLTRSGRVENAPTVPSRWLQRLTAIFGDDLTQQLKDRGTRYLDYANLLDQPLQKSKRIERPCPSPPVINRPKGLSITEIETWIRDPYAIYAKRILRLVPLPAIGTVSQPALRGTILHDAAAKFVQSDIDPFAPDAKAAFVSIVRQLMTLNKIPAHISALWMPRFEEVARDFILFAQQQKSRIKQSHCEIDGKLSIGDTGFQLRGRADRIDLMNDGSVEILDYKSGLRPTAAMARTLAPQLALEGAIIKAGGFTDLGSRIPSALEYVRMRPRGEFDRQAVNNDAISASELADQKLAELKRLVLKYGNPAQGYISRFAIEVSENITGDYDHLARVREWSWTSEDNAEGTADGGSDG